MSVQGWVIEGETNVKKPARLVAGLLIVAWGLVELVAFVRQTGARLR